MCDEIPEAPRAETPIEAEPTKEERSPASGNTSLRAFLLIFLFLGLALGLQIYALFSASAMLLTISLLCLIGGMVAGFVVVVKQALAGTSERWEDAVAAGRETYIRVREEAEERYNRVGSEKKRPSAHDTYTRVKEEASARYGRVRRGED
jgi:hypothetical protein